MPVSLASELTTRSAAIYAEFLIPHLTADARLIDIGCGSGSIALGLVAPRSNARLPASRGADTSANS